MKSHLMGKQSIRQDIIQYEFIMLFYVDHVVVTIWVESVIEPKRLVFRSARIRSFDVVNLMNL